jgi:cytochrome c oxidase subunit 2
MIKRHAWLNWFAVAMVLVCVACPALAEEGRKWNPEGLWGLPEGASSYAKDIDGLFYGILWLTGIVFVVTEGLLLIFILKFRAKAGAKSVYTHGNHKLEMTWTLATAATLGIIAIVQKDAWDKIKKPENFPSEAKGDKCLHIQTFAKQFEWNFRYQNPKGEWGKDDGICLTNQLVVPVNTYILFEQTSLDVIHSFWLPNMRLKQDVVPGMQIKLWFKPEKTTAEMRKNRPDFNGPQGVEQWNYEIVCAELCGIQHAQMRGFMEVLPEDEYKAWFEDRSAKQANIEAPALWEKWKVKDPKTGERFFPERKKEESEKKE